MLAALHGLARHARIDQVECLWEPYMILAARIREAFGLPGMTVEQTVPFRDKERMKQVLDAAGIRTPWHVSATTVARVWEAAEQIGYPLIVKPIAGAGSADTYRVDSAAELAEVLPMLRHVPEVSVEEFVEAEEFTYDTVCANGRSSSRTCCWYRPRPLQMRMHEWVSPVAISLRDLTVPDLAGRPRRWAARCWPRSASAPGSPTWSGTARQDGEVVFGEIAARPPGARVVDMMNYATDGDLYVGWAEAVVHGQDARADRPALQRRQHLQARAAARAGSPRSRGWTQLLAEYGEHVVRRRPAPDRRAPARLARHHRR